MTKRATNVNDIPRLGMTLRNIGCVVENQDDEMKCDVTFEGPWSRIEARSSRRTWPRVKASWLELQRVNMQTRVVCIAGQA